MKILVTGSAGFIGFSLARSLLEDGYPVIGIDNHNNYYDTRIKDARIKILKNFKNYNHFKMDICDEKLNDIVKKNKVKKIINLAAQAGVRYSIENPKAYTKSNIDGFLNILECCKNCKIEHLIFASTSSVYGANSKLPFSENHSSCHPLSLYAVTKKTNELMAHAFSHLFKIQSTGLRFFTVYGPWGRPDMALFKFTKSILENKPIDVYNHGNHFRDFTYIDDVINGIRKVIEKPFKKNHNWNSNKPDLSFSSAPWKVYNIGNNKKVSLLQYIKALENSLNKKAKINFLPMQLGDVAATKANISKIKSDYNFKPSISIEDGISKFVNWYLNFYKIQNK
jgi:UDP-glucuronate 4-epimerase